jgi:hypothetical protein
LGSTTGHRRTERVMTAGTALLRRPVTISVLAYDVLWESVVGGIHHPALLCDSPGATWTARSTHVAAAMAELRATGLAGEGGVDPELLATIGLLDQATRAVRLVQRRHGPQQRARGDHRNPGAGRAPHGCPAGVAAVHPGPGRRHHR